MQRSRASVHAVDGVSSSCAAARYSASWENRAAARPPGQAHHEADRSEHRAPADRRAGSRRPGKDTEDSAYRRRVQMIFQDPYASMNPHFRVRDVLEEPLLIHGIGVSRADAGAGRPGGHGEGEDGPGP